MNQPTHHHAEPEIARILLPLLRTGKMPALPEGSWERIADGLRRSGMAALALEKLRGDGAPDALVRRLEEERTRDRVSLTLLYDRLGRFADTMRSAGARFIALKGAALAPLLYGAPELRPMVDVDVLIRLSDWPKVRDALGTAGYRLPAEKEAAYWLANYFNMGVTAPGDPPSFFDLHWSLGQEVRYAVDNEGLWERATGYEIEGRTLLRLSDEDLLLSLILHLGYHYFDARLLWLWDIHLLCRRRPIDWDVVVERAGRWKMSTVLAEGLAFVESVFPGCVPAGVLERMRPGRLHRMLLSPLRSAEEGRRFRGDDRRVTQLVQGLLVMDSAADALRFMGDKIARRLRFLGARPRLR